jgi:hypothetical protein
MIVYYKLEARNPCPVRTGRNSKQIQMIEIRIFVIL